MRADPPLGNVVHVGLVEGFEALHIGEMRLEKDELACPFTVHKQAVGVGVGEGVGVGVGVCVGVGVGVPVGIGSPDTVMTLGSP